MFGITESPKVDMSNMLNTRTQLVSSLIRGGSHPFTGKPAKKRKKKLYLRRSMEDMESKSFTFCEEQYIEYF